MNKQIIPQEAPKLETLVSQIPKIKRGEIINFKKPANIFGYPVLNGSVKRNRASFGTKCPFIIEKGEIVTVEKNIIILQTRIGGTNVLFPVQYTK